MADRPDGKISPSFLSRLKMHLIQGIGFFIMCFIFLSAFLLPPRKEHLFTTFGNSTTSSNFLINPTLEECWVQLYSGIPDKKKPVFLLGTFVWMKFRSLPQPKELKFLVLCLLYFHPVN